MQVPRLDTSRSSGWDQLEFALNDDKEKEQVSVCVVGHCTQRDRAGELRTPEQTAPVSSADASEVVFISPGWF